MNILERVKYHRDDATYIGHQTHLGWRGTLPFYRFFCPKHGEVENYPQGWAEILRCPKCDEEHQQRQRSRREAIKRTEEGQES